MENLQELGGRLEKDLKDYKKATIRQINYILQVSRGRENFTFEDVESWPFSKAWHFIADHQKGVRNYA